VVNLVIGWTMWQLEISIIGAVVFAALTAYNAEVSKRQCMLATKQQSNDKLAIWGALIAVQELYQHTPSSQPHW
jgi:FtsH-binding integral membrane protein